MNKHRFNLKSLVAIFLVFVTTLAIFVSNAYNDYSIDLNKHTYRRLMPAADVAPNTFLPYLILKHQTLSFNKIVKNLRQFGDNKEIPYFLVMRNGNFYSAYPIITGLFALPFYVVPIILNKIPNLETPLNLLKVLFVGRIAASFYAALSVSVMYLILKEIYKNKGSNIWIFAFTAFYALGTNTWSVASRGLWQHTISQLIISVAVLLLIKGVAAPAKPQLFGLIGFVLGLAVLTRPTNIVLAIVVTVYMLVERRKQFISFLLPVGICAALFFFYNRAIFGSPFIEGYGARGDFDWSTPLTESLLGFAISPARSFLFISPPLILAYYTIYKTFKDKKFKSGFNTIYRYLGTAFILSLLLFAKWYTWDGAPAFGYRMLSDFLPIIGLLTFETIVVMKRWGTVLIIVLMIYSIYIHDNAVFNRKSRCSPEHNWSFYCLSPPSRKAEY